MSLKGVRPVDRQISVGLFVLHGEEAQAIGFYQHVLGAQILLKHELRDGTLSGADLQIADSVISVSGANPRRDAAPRLGGPCSPRVLGTTATMLHLYVADVDAVIARALETGATLRNPIEDAAWGDRVGAFTDPFGHIWALSTAIEDVDPAEMPERMRRAAERERHQRNTA